MFLSVKLEIELKESWFTNFFNWTIRIYYKKRTCFSDMFSLEHLYPLEHGSSFDGEHQKSRSLSVRMVVVSPDVVPVVAVHDIVSVPNVSNPAIPIVRQFYFRFWTISTHLRSIRSIRSTIYSWNEAPTACLFGSSLLWQCFWLWSQKFINYFALTSIPSIFFH